MAKVKKAVKKSQKKVVKKRIALKVPERIQNMDLITFFKTGERKQLEDWAFIEGQVLTCITNHPKDGDTIPAAVKVGGYTIINGDDVIDRVGDFDDVIDKLQDHGDKEITTSFVCLKNAGVDLHKVKVLDITKDLDVGITLNEVGFEEFDSNVPQGATLTSYRNDSYRLLPGDKDYSEEAANKIVEKRYHRAGCMLIREGKYSYICGMDDDSYFVTKLSKNVNTIDKAFQCLKPKEVQQWEKKNKAQARRQGEWYFLPTELTKVKGMRRKGLPLWKEGGNKHVAARYVLVDGKNYVAGTVTHPDHMSERLGNVVHEAIMNTQLGSWSEQGVD